MFLLPANEVYEGYVFTPVCQSFCSQGGGGVCLSACWDTPPGTDTPRGAETPRSRHPPSPLRSACSEIRATSGRYASYWNAYLLKEILSDEKQLI